MFEFTEHRTRPNATQRPAEQKKKRNNINFENKPFDKRSTLSNRPSTLDRNESKSNGAANP